MGIFLLLIAVLIGPAVGTAWAEAADDPLAPEVSAPAPLVAPSAPLPVPPSLPAPSPAAAPRGHAYFALDASLSYHYQLDESFLGGKVALEAGGQTATGTSIGGRVAVEAGRTLAGLTFFSVQWGPSFEWPLASRLHLGLLPYLGVHGIVRSTKDSDIPWSPVLGLALRTRVDLMPNGRGGGLFFHGEVSGDALLLAYSPFSLGLSAGLGYRF